MALHHVLGSMLKVSGLLKVAAFRCLHLNIFPLHGHVEGLHIGTLLAGLIHRRQDVLLIDWLLRRFLAWWTMDKFVHHHLHSAVGFADVLLQVPVLQVGLAASCAHKGLDTHVKVLVCLQSAARGEVLAAYVALVGGHACVSHFMRHQLGLLWEALHTKAVR